MPKENRSTELRDLYIKRNPLGLDEQDLQSDGSGFKQPATQNDFVAFCAGYETAREAQLRQGGQVRADSAITDLIEVRTSDLVGEPLGWAIAQAEGFEVHLEPPQYNNPWRVLTKQRGQITEWLTLYRHSKAGSRTARLFASTKSTFTRLSMSRTVG